MYWGPKKGTLVARVGLQRMMPFDTCRGPRAQGSLGLHLKGSQRLGARCGSFLDAESGWTGTLSVPKGCHGCLPTPVGARAASKHVFREQQEQCNSPPQKPTKQGAAKFRCACCTAAISSSSDWLIWQEHNLLWPYRTGPGLRSGSS